MSHRKKIGLLLVLSVIIFTAGYIILFPEKFGSYSSPLSEVSLGKPLVWGMPSIIFVLFILLFFSQKIFRTWSKFALFFVPLSVLWIGLTPFYCGGFFSLCITNDLLTLFLGALFLLSSLGIIIYQKIKERR